MGNKFTMTEEQKFETKMQNALTYLGLSFEDLQYVNPRELGYCRGIGKQTIEYAMEKLKSKGMRIGWLSYMYYSEHKDEYLKNPEAVLPGFKQTLGATYVWLFNETPQIGGGLNEYVIADTMTEAISIYRENNENNGIFSIKLIGAATIKR